jgi:HaeII restriction endonuclease
VSSVQEAKDRLDAIIKKARVDLYKPIQIAEVLIHSRLKV